MDMETQIRQALARGYCTPENEHKELDAVLIEAMKEEIIKSFSPDPNEDAVVGLLESRHTAMLEWVEPWPACGPEGNTVDAHITLRASVHDCINVHRAADKQAGRPTMGDDARRLDEFMAVHWATVVQPKQKNPIELP